MNRKQAPEPGSPIANLQMAARRAKDEGDLTQAEKFAKAARNLGADQNEEALKGVLRKLAKSKSRRFSFSLAVSRKTLLG